MKPIFLFAILFSLGCFAQNCNLIVPANSLTLAGLTVPFKLVGCNQSDPNFSTFVHAALIDVTTGKVYVYNPLVINDGDTPGLAPVQPVNPPLSYITGIWFGTNAASLTLVDDGHGSLTAANCVNGLGDSPFGQFAYCNAPAFFTIANSFIASGVLTVPPLTIAMDGIVCPTIRDFSIVDMTQSDNVITDYLVANNKIYQDTAVALAFINGTKTRKLTNVSDNRLLSIELAAAMGCPPWTAPDLANPGSFLPSLALNELQAAYTQAAPIALVPLTDPMARVSGQPSLDKVNLYRQGVDQQTTSSVNGADSASYCYNLYYTAPKRLSLNSDRFSNLVSPDPNVATSLFAYMASRLSVSFGENGLGCVNLLGVPNPVTLQTSATGVALGATIYVPPAPVAPVAATSSKVVATFVVVSVLCAIMVIGGTFLAYRWEQTRDFFRDRFCS